MKKTNNKNLAIIKLFKRPMNNKCNKHNKSRTSKIKTKIKWKMRIEEEDKKENV